MYCDVDISKMLVFDFAVQDSCIRKNINHAS